MGIGKAIRQEREKLGWTLEELERRSGVAVGTISALENRDSKRSMYAATLAKALGTNVEALQGGLSGSQPEIDLDNHPELARIRKVKLKLQAGISGFSIEPDEDEGLPIFFRSDWMAQRGFKPYELLALKIRGESMEPALHEGDVVVINTADIEPRDGEVFAVNYEGEPLIKRLVRDAGEWWMASDNPDQRRYQRKRWVDGDSFIVGRVVHKQSERI